MLKNNDEVNNMKNTISVRMHVSLEDIESLLYSAANGSEYWCDNAVELGYETKVRRVMNDPRGLIMIDKEEKRKYRLDAEALHRGLKVMAKHYKSDFADIINETADMNTSDVFLQCALFGKVIYG